MEVDITGGVWLPSDPKEPQLFRLDFLNLKMEQFYLRELPEILSEKPVSWLFNHKCKGCTFVNVCRSEADGTPGQIPYMTEEKAEELIFPDIEDLTYGLSQFTFDPVTFDPVTFDPVTFDPASIWPDPENLPMPVEFEEAHEEDKPVVG
jgi:hypothetical protein